MSGRAPRVSPSRDTGDVQSLKGHRRCPVPQGTGPALKGHRPWRDTCPEGTPASSERSKPALAPLHLTPLPCLASHFSASRLTPIHLISCLCISSRFSPSSSVLFPRPPEPPACRYGLVMLAKREACRYGLVILANLCACACVRASTRARARARVCVRARMRVCVLPRPLEPPLPPLPPSPELEFYPRTCGLWISPPRRRRRRD